MFSRRRAPPARPPVDSSTQAAATIAASSVFLSKNRSNTSLSSAAAAAALRSHTTSPEPVGSIQTKRMVRRGSTSSNGSGSVMGSVNGRPGLKRADSSGSMTERTFRAASPAQRNGLQASSNLRPASSAGYAPRITSPPPANGKRSSSADEATKIPASSARQAKRLSNVAEVADDEEELARAHANFATNFARRNEAERDHSSLPPPSPPASPTSGTVKKYTHGMGSWFKQGSGDSWPMRRPQSSDGRTYSMPSNLRANTGRPGSAAGASDRVYGITPGTSYSTPTKVYDPNTRSFVYTTGGRLTEPPSPTTQSPKVETVYDPNSRTFVPKSQYVRVEPPPPRPAPNPVNIGPVIAPKKQRAAPNAATPLQPPPKNPARFSEDEAATEPPRAVSALPKEPSVVREDPQAEQSAAAEVPTGEPNSGSKRESALLPAKTYVSPTVEPKRSASLDVPSLGMEVAGRGRVASNSPQRSAHFSPSPVLRPQVHVPPPRDVSPVKSAMKQSPASSVRTASPIATFSPLGTARVASPASETSETPSLTSQDGKRKKSNRVSFNEHAEEIVPPTVIASTIAARSEDMDDDVTMQPRPALPSFGSIRRDRIQAELAEKVTETPPARHGASSDHAIAGILRKPNDPLPPQVTSKESAGYVSDESSEADVPAASAAVIEPAKVNGADASKPVNGASNIRDFAATTTVPVPTDDVDVPSIALLPPTPKLDDDSKRDLSPTSEEALRQNRNSMEGITVPGGWKKDADESVQPPTIIEPSEATPEIFDGVQRPSTGDSAATMTVSPIQLTASPLQMSDIDEESDDAEFSDAFEDPSDFEDDAPGGFASLDAIVESPIVVPVASPLVSEPVVEPEPPESPSTQQAAKRLVPAADPEAPPSSPTQADWDEATTYWSKLSKERRAQIEREHLSSDDEPIAPVKKVKAKGAQNPPTSAAKKQQPAQPALRKSMRAQPAPVAADISDGTVHMRKSMRDGGANRTPQRATTSQRKADSASNERPVMMQKSLRPSSASGYSISSAGSETFAPRPSLQSNRVSQESAYPTLQTKNTASRSRDQMPLVSARLQKELARADDSDSESSFKKRRRAKNVDGRYTMRASMRGASVDEPEPPNSIEQQRPSSPTPRGSGTFGRLRSLSPPFSRSKASPAQNLQESTMRSSLRGNAATRSTLSQQSQPRQKARQTPAPTSRFRSRFADSDEEDEDAAPRRSFFTSRFADSDDDEPGSNVVIPANLTPVRGIPRRKGQQDGDSTDLSDEDDAKPAKTKRKSGKTALVDDSEVDKIMDLARRNLGLSETTQAAPSSTVHEGDALQKGSLRSKPTVEEDETPPSTAKPADVSFAPPDRKKRGFMGSILRRNRNASSTSVPLVRPTSPLPAPSPAVAASVSPATNIARPTSPDPATPTRPPLGKLRKNSNPTRFSRTNSNMSATTTTPLQQEPTPAVPKLSDAELDTWARPTSPVPATSVRPSTSDGFSPEGVKLAQTMRPDLAPRSQSHQLSGRRVQIQAGEEGSEPGEREPRSTIYSQRTGKKKKFGALRKVFGLND